MYSSSAIHGSLSSLRAAGFAQGVACPTCIGSIAVGGTFYNPFNPNYDGGTQYNLGSNLIWSPIKDLDIGVEVMYVRNQMEHKQFDVNRGNGILIKEDDEWFGRLRVSRDF